MAGSFFDYCKRITIGLLILFFGNIAVFSQKNLSGIFNQPSTHVASISSSDKVIVDNVTGLKLNDTVLLIQMQGVKILLSPYGDLQDKVGEPGLHEFITILNINTGTKEITFRNNILNSYDASGNVQLVRVPYYANARVTGTLTTAAWDPAVKSGGVLSFIVGKTLTLDHNIDVSGLGFRGGKDATGDGDCWTHNPGLYANEYYATTFTNAGFKGEGVANYTEFGQPLDPNYTKGLGPNWTGGGGGNAGYSGGGGGSNRGGGGDGGYESNSCSPPQSLGRGGIKADHPSLPDRIYFGGGGGASTRALPSSPNSYGGNGGGIVIIVAESITSTGGGIISNGSDGGTNTGLGGSGGGGAGGSIALSLNSYGSNPVGFSTKGGAGGNSGSGLGEGGGGGGGLVFVSTIPTALVTTDLSGGNSGFANGDPGELRQNFKVILNGFLYNSIRSSKSGDTLDYSCSNMFPPRITGTSPVGGNKPYTYKWKKSKDLINWTTLYIGPDSVNYTPAVKENTTVYFKRIVMSSAPSPQTDSSKIVKIIVQPYIQNNVVGNTDTICFAKDPPALSPKATLTGGTGIYTYKWQVSPLDTLHYSLPPSGYNSPGYNPPPALTVTSWYRRTVTSGSCIDSLAKVRITVLDTVQNNKILNSPPDICFGTTFVDLTATTSPALSGGDNTYRYKWESNINGSGWGPAPGVNNGPGYNPQEQPQRIPSNQYIFRRVVYSGIHDVCSSVSSAKLLKDFPVITGNNIAPVPPVCSGSKPLDITGSKTPTLSGGNTSYAFSWKDSTKTHSWRLISGATSPDFPTSALTDTTWYHRIVKAVCSDTSNKIRIIVHKPITNNTISVLTGGITQTICNNQTPVSLKGTAPGGGTNIAGDYAYLWKSSPDNSVFNPISGATGINYQPPSLSAATYYYKREVTSGACTVISNPITITVHPDITNNTITGKSKVCYGLRPDPINGAALSGGSGTYSYLWEQSTDGGTTWTPAALTNNSSDYQPDSLKSPVKYRRKVTSGLNNCCSSVSNSFDVGIDPMPARPDAGPDSIIFSIEKLYSMKAINPSLTGDTGAWTTLNGGTGSADNATLFNTVVRNLSPGKNSFLWTVEKGPCNLKDSVDIVLLDDFIPQGFSPNGDRWNNTFKIEGLNSEDQIVDFSIVNGAGTEIYSFHGQGDDIKNWKGWDGTNLNGNNLPEGTYYYLLKITSDNTKGGNGQVFRKKGFIILKRY